MTLKIYSYNRCSTCRNALKYLEDKKIKFEKIELAEKTPTKTELKIMLKNYNGDIKKLFNTSGILYREGNYKDKIPTLKENELIEILSKNFKLIRRPFLIGEKFKGVGFKNFEKIK